MTNVNKSHKFDSSACVYLAAENRTQSNLLSKSIQKQILKKMAEKNDKWNSSPTFLLFECSFV